MNSDSISRDIEQHLETISVSQLGGREGLLAVSGEEVLGMLLKILECTGQSPQQKGAPNVNSGEAENSWAKYSLLVLTQFLCSARFLLISNIP